MQAVIEPDSSLTVASGFADRAANRGDIHSGELLITLKTIL
jgi:hypothetical protein